MVELEPSITCPRCGRTSYSPGDIANDYCGWCHWWTSDDMLGQPEVIADAEEQGAIRPLPVRELSRKVVFARHSVELGFVLVAVAMAIGAFTAGPWWGTVITGVLWVMCLKAYLWGRRQERSLLE